MPQRQNTRTVKSDEVQGEGSYVVIRRLSFGDVLRLSDMVKEDRYQAAAHELVPLLVKQWNWVDDGGGPLPVPVDSAGVDALSSEEVGFLVNLAFAKDEAGKN